MKGLKWNDTKHQWQLGNVSELKTKEKHLAFSIGQNCIVVFYSTPSEQEFDYMSLPFPTNLPIYEGVPVAAIYKDKGDTQYKKVKGKCMDATKEHLKQFNSALKSADLSLLEVILDDTSFASKRNEDIHIEKDDDAPVKTIVINDSDSESSVTSIEGEDRHEPDEDDFSEEVSEIDQSDEEEEDPDEYEGSGDEY